MDRRAAASVANPTPINTFGGRSQQPAAPPGRCPRAWKQRTRCRTTCCSSRSGQLRWPPAVLFSPASWPGKACLKTSTSASSALFLAARGAGATAGSPAPPTIVAPRKGDHPLTHLRAAVGHAVVARGRSTRPGQVYPSTPADATRQKSATDLAIAWKSTMKPTHRCSDAHRVSYSACTRCCRRIRSPTVLLS